MHRWLWLPFVLIASTAKADLIDITFDAPTSCFDLCGLVTKPASYVEDGFLFTPTLGHYDLGTSMNIDTYAGSHATVRMTYESGLFDFLGMDVIGIALNPDGLPLDEVASIRSSAGGTLLLSQNMIGSLAMTDPLWRNLTWVEFDIIDPNRDTRQDNFTFDNLRLGTPEPSSLAILTGGAILWGMRKRRRITTPD